MREAALLAAFAALFCIRLGTVGLIDYDEAAYAQAAHEMWLRGDWLSPSLNGRPFFEKPPLLYWSQILAFRALGVGTFAARIPNALAALATLAALYGFSRRPLGARGAAAGVLVLGSSLAFVSLARVALTDLWLLLFIVLSLGCFHRALEAAPAARTGGSLWFVSGCACCGLAMLAKGAVGALLPITALLAQLVTLRRVGLLRRTSWWLPGGAALALIGLSWYLLLGLTRPDGFAFLGELVQEHQLGRFASAKEGHRGPVFYYLPVLVLALVPWSAWLPSALARRLPSDSERGRWLRLLGALSAVTFVFFSLAATKLPHYVTPALPGLALLVADRLTGSDPPPGRRALASSAGATVVLLVALAAGIASAERIAAALPAWLGEKAHELPPLAYPLELGPGLAAAALAALVTAVGVALAWRSPRRLAVRLGAGAWLVWACVAWGVMPRWDAHFGRPLRSLAASAVARDAAGEPLLLVGLRRRPSVTFYTGRATEYASPRQVRRLEARLAEPPPRLAIASESTFAALARRTGAQAIARDTGYVLFAGAGGAAGAPADAAALPSSGASKP